LQSNDYNVFVEIPAVVLEKLHEIEAKWPEALTTVYGPDMRIVYASANHLESGWSDEDMIGSHWTKFVPPFDYPHGELALEDALLNFESTEISVTGLTKVGQQLRMRVKGWRVDVSKSGGTFVIVRSLLLDPPNKSRRLGH
jgi:hypothetical protein